MELVDIPDEKERVELSRLQLDIALDFVRAIESGNYVSFEYCCRNKSGDEYVYFTIEPEIGQRVVNDIRYSEPLVVKFHADNRTIPYVYSRRQDFPKVTHLNADIFDIPKSLCLYETPYEELKLTWRANGFLERIREWLELTAEDRLHQDDQPLEAFLTLTIGSIVVPRKILEVENAHVYLMNKKYRSIRVAIDTKENPNPEENFTILKLMAMPQVHGYLKTTPTNLYSLDELMKEVGISNFISEKLSEFLDEVNLIGDPQIQNSRLLIFLTIPQKRSIEDTETEDEHITFLTLANLKEIGIKTRLFAEGAGALAKVVPAENFRKEEITEVEVGPLRTYMELDKNDFAEFSGLDDNSPRIGIIGVGALGSQLLSIFSRMGYGKWKVVDKDILLPHNLVRHSLIRDSLGMSKAQMVSFESNYLLNDPTHAIPMDADYLNHNDNHKMIELFSDVEVLLDTSASVAVARKLCHDGNYSQRRVSVFLSPSGKDLVILAEDKERKTRLDQLEMQYYRLIADTPALNNHLLVDGERIRYSVSCRDITSKIRQEDVLIHAGIASKALRRIIPDSSGEISIWSLKDNETVAHYTCGIKPTREIASTENWTVTIDEGLLDRLKSARSGKLPKETGGILLGNYDQERGIIYVIDTILSPSDSYEYPTSYYRGIKGVGKKLEELDEITSGNIQYIGEWHSHPDGASVSRSSDDNILFDWIKNYMTSLSLPPLMLIVGEHDLGVYTD